jgi:two-component system, chemotaxis family, response regulator Rcp1
MGDTFGWSRNLAKDRDSALKSQNLEQCMNDNNSTPILEILLVEDSKSDAYLAEETLTETNIPHRLHIVKDGVEALDFLYRRSKYTDVPRPDLILLDLNLPRKNGHEVLAELKSNETLKTIPIVVITTSNREEDRDNVHRLQARDYWIKPIDLDRCIAIMRSVS